MTRIPPGRRAAPLLLGLSAALAFAAAAATAQAADPQVTVTLLRWPYT